MCVAGPAPKADPKRQETQLHTLLDKLMTELGVQS